MKIITFATSINAAVFLVIASGIVGAANLPPIDPVGVYVLRSEKKKVITQTSGSPSESKQVATGFSGTIKVARIDKYKILLDLDGNKGFPSFNQGSFTATLTYKNNVAVYTPVEYDKSCIITMKWLKNAVIVSQASGDANTACGFGHAVAVDGFYRKISSKRPNFD